MDEIKCFVFCCLVVVSIHSVSAGHKGGHIIIAGGGSGPPSPPQPVPFPVPVPVPIRHPVYIPVVKHIPYPVTKHIPIHVPVHVPVHVPIKVPVHIPVKVEKHYEHHHAGWSHFDGNNFGEDDLYDHNYKDGLGIGFGNSDHYGYQSLK